MTSRSTLIGITLLTLVLGLSVGFIWGNYKSRPVEETKLKPKKKHDVKPSELSLSESSSEASCHSLVPTQPQSPSEVFSVCANLSQWSQKWCELGSREVCEWIFSKAPIDSPERKNAWLSLERQCQADDAQACIFLWRGSVEPEEIKKFTALLQQHCEKNSAVACDILFQSANGDRDKAHLAFSGLLKHCKAGQLQGCNSVILRAPEAQQFTHLTTDGDEEETQARESNRQHCKAGSAKACGWVHTDYSSDDTHRVNAQNRLEALCAAHDSWACVWMVNHASEEGQPHAKEAVMKLCASEDTYACKWVLENEKTDYKHLQVAMSHFEKKCAAQDAKACSVVFSQWRSICGRG